MFKRRSARIEDLYRKRERDADGIVLSDAEFFSLLRDDDMCQLQLAAPIRRKQWETAAGHLLEYYRERPLPVFFFSPSGRDDLVGALSQNKAATGAVLEWAEHLTNHTFYSPYSGTTSMGPYIDWYADLQGNSWFCEHVSGLRQKIFADRLHEQMALGDPQITWEFNKHEHLVELGKAYWLSKDERFSCEFVIQLVDWIEKNSCLMGINWVDELTVAQRAINWVWALHFFLPSDHVSPNFLLRCLKSLALHGAYLNQYLHAQPRDTRPLYRLAASCALYLIAQYMSEFHFSRDWYRFANETLIRATLEEFTPDGGHREGSLQVHRVALELSLIHYLVSTLNGESVDALPTRGRLMDALRFLAELCTPGGTFQPLGAGCVSRSLPFGLPFVSDPRGVLGIGALLFGRRDLKPAVGEGLPWHALWLMGPHAADRWARLEAEPPTEPGRGFPQTGVHVVREGWHPKDLWLLFRSGAPRPGGHDDRFHVSLCIGGETVFTDLGTSTLVPGWFDHARTHNVLAIRHARPVPGETETETPSLVRTGSRYWLRGGSRTWQLRALEGPGEGTRIEYRREVLLDLNEKWLVLRDVLSGAGEAEVDALFYHLPGLDMVQRGDQGCVLWKKGAWLRVQPYFPGNFRWFWDRPREKGQPPFYSPDGVSVQAASALRYHSTVTVPCEIYFWINWDSSSVGSPNVEDVMRLFRALPSGQRPRAVGARE